MALPYVKINFANGAIGGSRAMDDGCTGLVCNAEDVYGGFAIDTNYLITSLKELEALGITAESTGPNAGVHKCVSEFYAEAPKGTKLYLRGARTQKYMDLVDKEDGPAMPLLEYARGEIRTLVAKAFVDPEETPTVEHGLNEDVYASIGCAQQLAEAAAEDLKAPVVVLLEGLCYTGNPADLADLSERTDNRVAVVVGDTVAGSDGAAVGLLAGRLAAIPVHRCAARVKDGAIAAPHLFIGDVEAESGHPDLIHDRGFICPRTFTGKAGYYWSDDPTAAAESDDYRYIARRRTADKAARIAYAAMLDYVADEIAVTAEGKIVPAVAKNIETVVESAVINQMTAKGNLSTDPDDPNDTGVQAYVDPDQNIVATSHLDVQLRIRPYGYAKYIEINLGFQTLNN